MPGTTWTDDPILAPTFSHTTVYAVNSAGELHAIRAGEDTTELLRAGVDGPPAVLSWASETFMVARTSGRDLVARVISDSEPASEWQSIGEGRRWSAPTALLWRRGAPEELDFSLRQFVFSRDETRALWYTVREFSGFASGHTWRPWQSLGGNELAEFAVAPRGVDELVVYARHPDTHQVYRHVLRP